MSKLVVVSDIHGNFPALKAVVEKEGWDEKYAALGDIHGLLSYPQETQTLVQTLDGYTLAGNHDKAVFHEGVGHVNSQELSEFELSHTINSLSHEQIDWMEERSFLEVVQLGEYRVCLCHAYPWPEQASGYEKGNDGVRKNDVPHVASAVSDDYDFVLHGHTHEQYEVDCSPWTHDVHFINPGTLGYEGEYATVDTETGEVCLKSVEYDTEQVKAHIKQELPDCCPSVEDWGYLP